MCDAPVPDDGLVFLASTVHAEPIREEAVYDGIRVTFEARLGTAKIPVQVDVGFGDATTPPPDRVEIPPLLDLPPPVLQGYRRELVVAEKFHAMVDLGMANSRMKDFFDIWFLSQRFSFDGAILATAVKATFERRRTAIRTTLPLALTSTFAQDATKVAQWSAFTKRTRFEPPVPSLPDVTEAIARMLGAVLEAASAGRAFTSDWPPGGPWRAAGQPKGE